MFFFFSVGLTVSAEAVVIWWLELECPRASLAFLMPLWKRVGSASRPGWWGLSLPASTPRAAPSPRSFNTVTPSG